MASTCYLPIANSYPYRSIFELGIQSSKPPASPGAQPLGFATSFNLSTVGELAPPIGQFLSSGRTANLSDDEGFPFLNYRAHPKVIDLTVDDNENDEDSDGVTEALYPPSLPRQTSPARDLLRSGVGGSNLPAVHDTPVVIPPPRKSPFKNRPSWAIRKPTPEVLQPVIEPVQQPTAPGDAIDIFTKVAETYSWPALDRTNKHDVHRSCWSGVTLKNGTDKSPPFAFDVFTEDDDGLVSNVQSPAKRRRRASSASSTVRTGQALTPLVANLSNDIGLRADLNQKGKTLDGHEWQAQCIFGERQTLSGLEYEVSVAKTLWLPRATVNTKLVRRYRAEQRAKTRTRTRWSSRLQRAGSSVIQQH